MNSQQTLYHVHIYREMRLHFRDVRATSVEDAARLTADRPTDEADTIDDCEGETLAALVDLDGDSEYAQSRLIDFRAQRRSELLSALRSLEAALNHHAHWLPTMPAHLARTVRQAIILAHAF